MYGGLIAVVGGGLWYLWRHKLPVWPIADIGAVCGAIGLGVGRIGCTLAGCDYGKPVDASFPLAVKFPSYAAPGNFFGLTVPALPPYAPKLAADGWLHPTQVYQSLAGFLTAIILYFIWKHRRFPGEAFCAILVLKPLYRFIIEEFRGDEDRGFVSGFSQAQVVGMAVAAIAVAIWLWLWRRWRRSARVLPA
jgi:phosphatidylglycerol---prolipoprotein diacylglyceryl transferase